MRGDPYYMTARVAGTCAARDCQQPIRPGDRIYWYPNGRVAYAVPCGCAGRNERDFQAAAFDEAYGL